MSDIFQCIVFEQVCQFCENGVQVVDICDLQSFVVGYISGLWYIDNYLVVDFIVVVDFDVLLVVVCYYGNFSQSVVVYFIQQGFSDVYSFDGGFELWCSVYFVDISSGEVEQVVLLFC